MSLIKKSDYVRESKKYKARKPSVNRKLTPKAHRSIRIPTQMKTTLSLCAFCGRRGWSQDQKKCKLCHKGINLDKHVPIFARATDISNTG